MQKLTEILDNNVVKTLYEKNKKFKILEKNGWYFVNEPDMLICIPYFVENNTIALRYEEIPPYNYILPHNDKYVVCMSESFEKDELPLDVLKRGLIEEYGIKIDDTVQPEILQPIFSNKGNTACYHFCILPLYDNQYEQIKPTTDGSEYEKNTKNLIVNVNDLKNLIIYDLSSKYAIDLFLKHYSIFK